MSHFNLPTLVGHKTVANGETQKIRILFMIFREEDLDPRPLVSSFLSYELLEGYIEFLCDSSESDTESVDTKF